MAKSKIQDATVTDPMDRVIDAESFEVETAVGPPPFGFSERAAQSPSDVAAQVAERIKKHEQQLTEEELELWEQRFQGADTTMLEQRIGARRVMIAQMVDRYNAEFMANPESPDSEDEQKGDNA